MWWCDDDAWRWRRGEKAQKNYNAILMRMFSEAQLIFCHIMRIGECSSHLNDDFRHIFRIHSLGREKFCGSTTTYFYSLVLVPRRKRWARENRETLKKKSELEFASHVSRTFILDRLHIACDDVVFQLLLHEQRRPFRHLTTTLYFPTAKREERKKISHENHRSLSHRSHFVAAAI